MADNAAPAHPPRRRPPGWLRWAARLLRPAVLVAVLGLVGLAATLRAATPPPAPAPAPVRYDSGAPLAARLVLVFAPQLDDKGVAALAAALAPRRRGATAAFTIARPDYTPFAEATVLLLAGDAQSATEGVSPATPPSQPPDTLVRALDDRGPGARLLGPPTWRGLFAVAATAPPAATPAPDLVAEAAAALRGGPDRLIALYLADLGARDIGGDQAEALAGLGAALGERDALLVVGGGGAPGAPLAAALSGPAVRATFPRGLPLNDVAPTCAVLLGAPYPFDARGAVAWALLDAGEQRKALATAALARQRATLAARVVPFGAPYPHALQTIMVQQLPAIETAIAQDQYAFAYQLASSALSQADQTLATTVAPAVYVPLRRASWPLAAACLALALAGALVALVARAGRALAAATVGLALGLGCWAALVALLDGLVVPALPVVGGVLVLPAAVAGGVCAGLAAWRRAPLGRAARAIEVLVLLAALPAAFCAYRYGPPWQLRLEETAPLFRWRAALLAPALLLIAGAAWLLALPQWRKPRGQARRGPSPTPK
ncbi:MAG TPA: hypothetical protein VFW96_22160 [Thermomicrobiales bacterium]|nr:hypothetical protein [Thermomicrobiales bacterium]